MFQARRKPRRVGRETDRDDVDDVEGKPFHSHPLIFISNVFMSTVD